MSANWFHARLAAAALLKMAKTTTDPGLAANLVRVAANLKDQAGELPIAGGVEAPDVQSELGNDIGRFVSLRPNLEASISTCPCRPMPTDGDQMAEDKSDAASCKKYHQDHKTSHWASLL